MLRKQGKSKGEGSQKQHPPRSSERVLPDDAVAEERTTPTTRVEDFPLSFSLKTTPISHAASGEEARGEVSDPAIRASSRRAARTRGWTVRSSDDKEGIRLRSSERVIGRGESENDDTDETLICFLNFLLCFQTALAPRSLFRVLIVHSPASLSHTFIKLHQNLSERTAINHNQQQQQK